MQILEKKGLAMTYFINFFNFSGSGDNNKQRKTKGEGGWVQCVSDVI